MGDLVAPAPFPPSRLVVDGRFLADTLGRYEVEVAAALLVRTCAALGDRWAARTLGEVFAVFEAAVAEGREPWRSASANPFIRPDFGGLISRCFAVAVGEGEEMTLALTTSALERIGARWAWPPLSAVEAATGLGWAAEDLEPLPFEHELGVSAHG